MLKASNVLLRVAAIVGTIYGAILLVLVPALFICGFSTTIRDMLVQAMYDGTITVHSNDLPYENIAALFQAMFIILGCVLLNIGAMCVINAIIAVRTRREPTRGRYIASIITGALTTDFSLIAGIFGLICLSRAERQKRFEE